MDASHERLNKNSTIPQFKHWCLYLECREMHMLLLFVVLGDFGDTGVQWMVLFCRSVWAFSGEPQWQNQCRHVNLAAAYEGEGYE
jgi:hypothetical protein